jgi:HEAT repeat protein
MSRRALALAALAVLAVIMPFWVWQQTWFGRKLSNQEVSQYLRDNERPRRIQHALAQISGRISNGDSSTRAWYPDVAALARHPDSKIRLTSAWVMGQDTGSEVFHETLRGLLKDSDLMVRRNAALSLVRFRDASGRAELLEVLKPFYVRAPESGIISIELEAGQTIGSGALLARITSKQGQEIEVRSPFASRILDLAQDESQVAARDQVALLEPAPDQVWEVLRAMYLIGEPADLHEIESFTHKSGDLPAHIQRQAELTLRAIRMRSERTPSR